MARVELDTEFHGWDGSQEISSVWHKGPTMSVSGEQICDRSSAQSKNIDYYVHIESVRHSGTYGYPVTVSVVVGGTLQTIADSYGGVTYYGAMLVGGTIIREEVIASTGGTGMADFTGSFECTDNNTNVYVIIWCNGGGEHECDSSSWGHPNIVVGGIGTNELIPYNPYTPPSVTINSRKERGTFNVTNDYWVKYTINPGTNAVTGARLEIIDSNGNIKQSYESLSTTTGSEQTKYYTINDSNLNQGRSLLYKNKNMGWSTKCLF